MRPEQIAELRRLAETWPAYVGELKNGLDLALDEIERLRSAIIHAASKHCGPQDKCEFWGANEICDYLCDAIGYKDTDAEYDE